MVAAAGAFASDGFVAVGADDAGPAALAVRSRRRSLVAGTMCAALVAVALPLVIRESTAPRDLGAAPVFDAPKGVGAAIVRPAAILNRLIVPAGSDVIVGSATARADLAANVAPAAPIPVALSVPDVNLTALIVSVGVADDGGVEIPSDVDIAGWYRFSGRPGQEAPVVLVGHVDAASQGPGAFAALGGLEIGNVIVVHDGAGSEFRYTVTARRTYLKGEAPLEDIFSTGTGLRLVTCGGEFDLETRSYESNVVVYAEGV